MYFWTSVFIQDQLLWSVVFALYNMFTALIFFQTIFFSSIILGIFVFLSSSDCLLEFVLQIVFTVDFIFYYLLIHNHKMSF